MEDGAPSGKRALSRSLAQSKTLNSGLFGRIRGFAC